MTALYRNDRPGEHAPSWYAASLPHDVERPALKGDVTADVAILGAGFTGLWAALTLARAGRSVVVLDAHRVGFGASGRNGGQVNLGFNQSQQALEAKLGETRARALWDLAEAARRQLARFLRNPRARGRIPPRRGLCGIQPPRHPGAGGRSGIPRQTLRIRGRGDGSHHLLPIS
jgi:gamma-glutamylputrescine oxidase